MNRTWCGTSGKLEVFKHRHRPMNTAHRRMSRWWGAVVYLYLSPSRSPTFQIRTFAGLAARVEGEHFVWTESREMSNTLYGTCLLGMCKFSMRWSLCFSAYGPDPRLSSAGERPRLLTNNHIQRNMTKYSHLLTCHPSWGSSSTLESLPSLPLSGS